MPRMHSFTDTVSYFASPTTHDLLTALFGEQEEGDWREQALCAQVDGDMWFPEKGGSVLEAKRLCQDCPVRLECLEYALANAEHYGIWGGLSERERRPLVRDVRAAELPPKGEKRCRTCQTVRPVSEFYGNQSTSDGLKATCRECCRRADQRRRSRPVAA